MSDYKVVPLEPTYVDCPVCHGDGYVPCPCDCPLCEGLVDCERCEGYGRLAVVESKIT